MEKIDLINRYKNSIIIGKEESRTYFNGLKKDIPSLNFVFYSVDEVLDMFFYEYDDRAISYCRSSYEFDPVVATEAVFLVSLLTKDSYESKRFINLLPLKDDLLLHGFLRKRTDLGKIFDNKNILFFGLETALPLSSRLGEFHNMAISFDIPIEGIYIVNPSIEKYRCLTLEEKEELALYEN